MKAVILLLLSSVPMLCMDKVGKSPICARSSMGPVSVIHANDRFNVIQGGKIHEVQPAWVDKELRGMTAEQVAKYIKHGNMLKVQKADNGEFSIRAHNRVRGGGVGGATIGAFLGKAAVSVVGHGTIAIIAGTVGLFNPPAGWAVAAALESTCGPAIEAASIKGAIAGGILGGVASGPA